MTSNKRSLIGHQGPALVPPIAPGKPKDVELAMTG